MRVFVTGGSGFVGGHFIESIAKSHEVRALARSDASAKLVERYGATPVRADLASIDAAALEGCDAVVHSAAYVEEWGTREDFWRGNVDGTTHMLEIARAAKVRRFVHVGTEAALFDGHDLVDVDEDRPYPDEQRYLYSETKAEAERCVLAANADGFEAISIRPRLVWGPRDTSVLPAIVRMAKAGRFAWLGGGKKMTSTAHVRNVARALELALDHGRGGRAYFIADDGVVTVREFLTALAKTQGIDLGDKNVPIGIARPLAAAIEGTWRLFGVRATPPMTRFAVDMMSSTVTVKTDRAKAELGWSPVVSREEGLRAMGLPSSPQAE